MPDNTNLRNDADRRQVASGEQYEVKYIAEKMGVSENEVHAAIKAVGTSRAKIEEYLTDNSKH